SLSRASRAQRGSGGGAVVRVDPPPGLHPAAAGGRSDCAATDAAASAGSLPTRRPLRALRGNKATRGGQNPHRLLPGRGASPAAAVACALLFLGFRQGGKQASGNPRRGRASPGPRVGGFGSAEPTLIRPPPLAALGHPRLHSEGTSRSGSWTLVAKRQPGPRAGRWEYYKSQQAPRRERRSGRRGPA
ncbi:hypothetical protein EI555_017552, partial [Monodon monoceros]